MSLKFYLVMTNLLATEVGSLSMAVGHQKTKTHGWGKGTAKSIIHIAIGNPRRALVWAQIIPCWFPPKSLINLSQGIVQGHSPTTRRSQLTCPG